MVAALQRVKKVELWSIWKIMLIALACAIVVVVIHFSFFMVLEALVVPSHERRNDVIFLAASGVMVTLAIGLPAGIAIRFHPRLRRWWHGMLFGGLYGMLLPLLALAAGAAVVYLENGSLGPPRFIIMSVVLMAVCAFLPVGALIFLLFWNVSRKSRGPLRVIDGLLCPSCGYNLTGNRSWICPECGQPFTVEDLEVEETEDARHFLEGGHAE